MTFSEASSWDCTPAIFKQIGRSTMGLDGATFVETSLCDKKNEAASYKPNAL